METVIKVKSEELNQSLIDKLTLFLTDETDVEITINLKEKSSSMYLYKESPEEYLARLEKSMDDVENNRNLVSFTVDEFEKFSASLLNK